MNIPLELIVAGFTGLFALGAGIVGFFFRVVFGLVAKNEAKSDEADRRLEGEMRTMDERYRSNDRELYKQCSSIAAELEGINARLKCRAKE